MSAASRGAADAQGYTLIEVLVATLLLSMVSLMAWRGIDVMVRTAAGLQARGEQLDALQAVLEQWRVDLDRMTELGGASTWSWDGNVLRLTRAHGTEAAAQVVAWAWRADADRPGQGTWLRWQSQPCRTVGSWQQAWQDAAHWGRTPTDVLRRAEMPLATLQGWTLWVHRGGHWTHPQSSATTSAPGRSEAVDADDQPPDAVRLVVELPPTAPLPGRLTLDWIRPAFVAARS
ncbi:MAG: hypothetical protein RLZZ524_3255 [Pseudomonadota bacterium]|jgi:general secretion pathway protein J